MPAIDRSFPAERVRAVRAWLGLTRDEMAAAASVSARTVAEFEADGAPCWFCYTLLAWAVLVHGATPRAAARHFGLPWERFPLPPGASPDSADGASADDSAELAADDPATASLES